MNANPNACEHLSVFFFFVDTTTTLDFWIYILSDIYSGHFAGEPFFHWKSNQQSEEDFFLFFVLFTFYIKPFTVCLAKNARPPPTPHPLRPLTAVATRSALHLHREKNNRNEEEEEKKPSNLHLHCERRNGRLQSAVSLTDKSALVTEEKKVVQDSNGEHLHQSHFERLRRFTSHTDSFGRQ